MSENSLFDPDREIEPAEDTHPPDGRVRFFVLLVLALVIGLLAALIAYYFFVIRPITG